MNFLLRRILVLFLLSPYYLLGQGKVKMERVNGVMVMPCTVNGLKLDFIFDTGASNVTISLTEALFMLKNNYLSAKDILGTEQYKIANGNIEEGTIVILREIEIGGYSLYNVPASIIHKTNAPLLLGQTAISKLGRYEFNYSNRTLNMLSKPNSEMFIDKRDNQSYKTVRIGSQVWMAQNLNYLSDEGSYQEENQPNIYGRFYNWETALKVCPEGWHLPSDKDWDELESFTMSKYPSTNSLKSESIWDNGKGTDELEFAVFPSGMYKGYGTYIWRDLSAWFWTSTSEDYYSGYGIAFYSYTNSISKGASGKSNGFSVRCLKD
jgi:clan AA aspartic protease (TIGR02281 family)